MSRGLRLIPIILLLWLVAGLRVAAGEACRPGGAFANGRTVIAAIQPRRGGSRQGRTQVPDLAIGQAALAQYLR